MRNPKKNHRPRSRKNKQGIQDIPLTPMIDVVFQMLIYFVLTFEIPDRMSTMQVWRPSSPGIETNIPLDRITVHNGYYTFNGTRLSLDRLDTLFERYSDLNPNQNMIIVATGESKHQELVQVLNLLEKAGLENVSLLSAQ